MERPEIYTDNYNSLEEWIELRKRNEEFVYPQFFVPFREWMKDIEQKSDMEIKELLRILLQPYTLGVGYKVNLTKATRDGGKDIIAEINENERKEKVFVECKLYKTCELKKETVRALGYTMLSEEATRAVIFTSGYATKALKEMDTRIQIFDMEEMILLLNANLGERWYADFERLKSNFMKEMS